MKTISVLVLTAAVGIVSAEVRNGDFSRMGGKPPVQTTIDQWRAAGIQCPDQKEWTPYWSCIGKNGTVEFPKDANGNRFARISGKGLLFCGYHGLNIIGRTNAVLSVSLRGSGAVRVSFLSYKREGGKAVFDSKGSKAYVVKVDSKSWTKYSFPVGNRDDIFNIHPAFCANEGTIDIDNAVIYSQKSREDLYAVAVAEEQLRKTGKFLAGDENDFEINDSLKPAIEAYKKQDQALKEFVAKNPQDDLAAKLMKLSDEVRPYLLADGVTKVGKDRLNRAAALCIAIEKITAKGK